MQQNVLVKIIFNSSNNLYFKYMTCDLIKDQQVCDNQFYSQQNQICQWNPNSNSCQIKISSLTQSLYPCVEDLCEKNLQGLDFNISQFKTPNCSFTSFLNETYNSSQQENQQTSIQQDNGQNFCKIVQSRANYFGVHEISNQQSQCSSQLFSNFNNQSDQQEMLQPTKVDTVVAALMNLHCSDRGDFNFDGSTIRAPISDSGNLDVILGLEKGTLDSIYACQNFIEESTCGQSPQVVTTSGQMSQDLDLRRNKRGSITSTPGSLTLIMSIGLFLFGLIGWGLRFRIYLFVRTVLENEATTQQQNDQITTQHLVQNLQKYRFTFNNKEKIGGKYLSEMDICSICYENFREKEEGMKLRCEHIYHAPCIEKWVETKGKNSTCPLCGQCLREEESNESSAETTISASNSVSIAITTSDADSAEQTERANNV
eukprot:TRINITY_DN7909_c2_g1_i1.p1 TRINITY_DN7909_c2_g1~~TRINITY_DN7909_c2_g1_i1.p1  ORF type:complete len:428 (-),score=37.17 TRINITY_DN7909_c2_g1_i1:376-1659(-)